ncbi:MAG TPA: hypothetical protein H9684_08810 [Firmicutes bacterium]|nr:hypothetical protein [Bacillota bacterium]
MKKRRGGLSPAFLRAGVVLTAGALLLSGCGVGGRSEEGLSEERLLYAGATPNDPASREFREVLSRDGLTLLVNDDTAEVAVRDGAGNLWYSNPQDRDTDPVASQENRDNMAAQARILFSDSTGNTRSMNTYTDAVARGQYRITEMDDGLVVQYTLGAVEEKKLVPVVVEKERFEEKILNRLDGNGKKAIERYYMLVDLENMEDADYRRELEVKYPAAKKGPVWVLRSNPPAPNVEEKIHAVISPTGYTLEDLEADNAANQVADAPTQQVFNLAIHYSIEDGRLLASLPAEELEMPEEYLIERVALLEHFGAARRGAEGYILLPDGSGSLLYFDNGKEAMASYSVPIYGQDPALYLEETPYRTDGICLPVFGLKNGGAAFLAVVEEGAALASVNAQPSGAAASYNTVYPLFRIREKAVQSVGGSDSVQNIYQAERYGGVMAVSYRFLSGADADYVGMAKICRRALFRGQEAPVSGQRPVYLELVGAIPATENVAGLPVERTRALTTFAQAEDILRSLPESGLTPSAVLVRYSGMFNGGMRQSYASSLDIVGALGGDKGFSSLLETAGGLGVSVYPDIDLCYVAENGLFDAYNVRRDTARFLTRVTAAVYPYNPATFALDTEASPSYLISPRCYPSLFAAWGAAFAGLENPNLSLRSLGRTLAADYREDRMIDRQTALDTLDQAMEPLRAYSLMIEGGNAYLLDEAAHVVEMPMDSCGYDVCDESVPFLQLVVSGCVNYAGQPFNLSSGSRRDLLRAVETGAGFAFTVTAAGSDQVKDTDYSRYYACEWSYVRGVLREVLEETAPADGTAGLEMTNHEKLADGVYRTTFADGRQVVVNYNRRPYADSTVRVEAESYAVI